MMWYFPVIPYLKYLFRNKARAKLMRWHKDEHKQDMMLRHATDGSQWSKINKEFPDFADNTRNLMFGLIKDGMNLFGK